MLLSTSKKASFHGLKDENLNRQLERVSETRLLGKKFSDVKDLLPQVLVMRDQHLLLNDCSAGLAKLVETCFKLKCFFPYFKMSSKTLSFMLQKIRFPSET